MPVWESRLVQVEGDVALAVHELGTGVEHTLLVVHGGPDWDHSYLRRPLSGTAGRRRLLLPDLRGCGMSTRGLDLRRYTPAAAVADLLRLLDEVDLAEVDLLGFSYGGLLAQRLTVLAPGRIRRLVLASTTAIPGNDALFGSWPERERRLRTARQPLGDVRLTPDYCQQMAVAQSALDVWRPTSLLEWRTRLDAIQWSSEWWRALDAGLLSDALPDDSLDRLREVALPVLFLHGQYDMRFPAAGAAQAAAALPGSTLAVVPEAGHMAHVDQPTEWLNHLEAFLADDGPD